VPREGDSPRAEPRAEPHAKPRAKAQVQVEPQVEPHAASRAAKRAKVKTWHRDRVSKPATRFDDEDGVGLHSLTNAYRSRPKVVEKMAVDKEEVPAFCTKGAHILAAGWHICTQKTFEADVVAIRARHPRIHVRYVKCVASGQTVRLALPEPIEAFLHAGQVAELV
jgi:hypothetical protein